MRCNSPYVKFDLLCAACKQVDALEKQNKLIEDTKFSSGDNYDPVREADTKVLAGIIVLIALLPFIFWDSAPMIFIRGIIGIIVR